MYGKYIKKLLIVLICYVFLTRLVLAPLPDYNMFSTKPIFNTSNTFTVSNKKMHIVKVYQDENNILLLYRVYGFFPSLSKDKTINKLYLLTNDNTKYDIYGLGENIGIISTAGIIEFHGDTSKKISENLVIMKITK